MFGGFVEKNVKKIGIDIHGVIDTNPEFYSHLTRALYAAMFEIHVLTGSHITPKIKAQLRNWGISYTHLFSISDYHKEKGTKMWGDDTNPWMSDEDWNPTKAEYCKRNNIDLCIDDRDAYFEFFSTPVARYYSKGIEKTFEDLKKDR